MLISFVSPPPLCPDPPQPVFKARGTQAFNDAMSRPAEIVGGSISSLLPIKCFLDSQSYAPFIINMLLPPVVIALAALVLVPTTFVELKLRAHRNDPGVEAPAFKGKFNIPDFLACWRVLRQPMTEGDVAAWRAPFVWTGRLAGVAVFALFFLYPTLVASIASIFNCSAPVSGKRYLLADLTVVCNEGGHIALIFFACIGGAVYAVGIPVAGVIATALKAPLVCHGAANAETNADTHVFVRAMTEAADLNSWFNAGIAAAGAK